MPEAELTDATARTHRTTQPNDGTRPCADTPELAISIAWRRMLTPNDVGDVLSVRQGLVDHRHGVAGVAVVEPDRADAGVRLERSRGHSCRMRVHARGRCRRRRPASPSLRRPCTHARVGRGAVRRVERGAAALGASPSFRHSNRVCTTSTSSPDAPHRVPSCRR